MDLSSADTEKEKLFINWIISNENYFKEVKSSYFENEYIRDIYRIIKKLYIKSDYAKIPGFLQIRLEIENKGLDISQAILKNILVDVNLNDVDHDWLSEIFTAWILRNKIFETLTDLTEEFTNLNDNESYNLEAWDGYLDKLRTETLNIDVDLDSDDKLYYDYDVAEDHVQPTIDETVPTGFNVIDSKIGGGMTAGSLHIIMGRTNIGKSIFLHNIAANAYNAGYNVAIMSLEMSTPSMMKRLDSMILDIDIKKYDFLTKDPLFIKDKLTKKQKDLENKSIRIEQSSDGFKDSNELKGHLLLKKLPASKCTPFRLKKWVRDIEVRRKIKINLLVLDYLSLMNVEEGSQDANMLYTKGKNIAENVRSLCEELQVACLTVSQISKEKMKETEKYVVPAIGDIPESKVIVETADSTWGIVQTESMKSDGVYHLKHLKMRDGEIIDNVVVFDFDKDHLKLNNARIWDDEMESYQTQ